MKIDFVRTLLVPGQIITSLMNVQLHSQNLHIVLNLIFQQSINIPFSVVLNLLCSFRFISILQTGMNKDDIGFDLVGGKDDPQYPNDNSIFVSHVSKGSLAGGKLK